MNAFGTLTPITDAKPTCGRLSSLENYKREISYSMSNRLIGFNIDTEQEIFAKSVAVNHIIKMFEEVRG